MEGTNGFTAVNPPTTSATPPTAPAQVAVAGTKRKRSPKSTPLKFYAVRVGKEPGIYHSWAECLDQVRGHPKAAFKSFFSLTDAQAFVNDADSSKEGGGKGGGGKFYGVREGRNPGVYTSWPEVLEQITGWKNPKHKGFKTRTEAELFVNEGSHEKAQPMSMGLNGGTNDYAPNTIQSIEHEDIAAPPKKVAKTSKKSVKNELPSAEVEEGGEYAPGEAPLPLDTEDNFDTSIILDSTNTNGVPLRYKTAAELAKTKYQAIGPAKDAPIRIYTDGSALSNGQDTSIGGVGVYFGPKDRRNVSEPLTGTKQTNQRAELTAILRALEVAPRDRKAVIVTDSYYVINCVTKWFVKWRWNNWHNASNKPVENKDLVGKIIDMLEERVRLNKHRMSEDELRAMQENGVDGALEVDGEEKQHWDHGPASVKFEWVKGHAKDEGNNAADELAVSGARAARELGEEVVLD